MLNNYQKGSIFGATLVALSFAFAFSHIQQPQNSKSGEQASSVSSEHHPDKPAWDAIDYLTLGLVMVGAVQAGLFIWQLGLIRKGLADTKEAADAARDTAKATTDFVILARETAERQLRAYVFVDYARATLIRAKQKSFAEIVVRNFGKTPAYKGTFKFEFDVRAKIETNFVIP